MKRQSEKSLLLLCDRQQSVLSSTTPQQRTAIAYTAFGHATSATLGFNGELPERRTGHYLLGNGYRAYNPLLMRFNSPDSWSPFGRGGLNPYAYCLGDPINHRDPTGHFAWGDGLSIVVGLLGIGFSVTTLGVGTPLGMLAFSLGAAAEATAATSVAKGHSSGGSELMWVALGLAAVSSVVAMGGGLFDKLKDVGSTARNALVPSEALPAQPLSAAREHIAGAMSRLQEPSSFSRALDVTNRSLGSHGDDSLSLAHAKKYVKLSEAVEAGSISNTTAHARAAQEWAGAGGPSGLVGAVFNGLGALGSGGVDHMLRKTGKSIRRTST